LSTYPGYASWQIEDVANIGITLGGAMLGLVPVTMFCFAIMARHSAKTLSLHFLLVNALLLLPIRGSLAAGTVGLLGVLYALTIVNKLTQSNTALQTGEGKFALATLFIPLGIIMFRSMYFYHVDSLMVAMVSLALFLAARQASLFPDRSARLATLLEVLSLPLALIAALAVTGAFELGMNSGLLAPLFAGTYAVLALDIIRRTASRILSKVTGVSVSLFVALSFTFSVANSPSAMTALLSLLAGVTLLLWGLAGRKPFATIAGIVTVIAAFKFGAIDILQLIANSSWIDLAIFGATAIALGSVIDRHGVAIKLRITKWFNTVREEKEPNALKG